MKHPAFLPQALETQQRERTSQFNKWTQKLGIIMGKKLGIIICSI